MACLSAMGVPFHHGGTVRDLQRASRHNSLEHVGIARHCRRRHTLCDDVLCALVADGIGWRALDVSGCASITAARLAAVMQRAASSGGRDCGIKALDISGCLQLSSPEALSIWVVAASSSLKLLRWHVTCAGTPIRTTLFR
jgi:hypothetical protein